MKIAYSAANWPQVIQILENNHQTLGRSHTQAGACRPALLSDQELAERSRQNAVKLYQRLFTMLAQPRPSNWGCGRISRGLSAWLLTWAGAPIPSYTQRGLWFDCAHQGLDSFVNHLRDCCQHGALLLASNEPL